MNIAIGNFYEGNEKMNYENENMKGTILGVLSIPKATHCPEEKNRI